MTTDLGVAISREKELLDFLFEGIDVDAAFNPTVADPYVRGHVVGFHLDNAFGEMLNIDAIRNGFQEYVLVLETATHGQIRSGDFNVADLVAIIRANAEKINQAYPQYFDLLHRLCDLTKECRDDMHEPDNQGVVLFLRYSVFNTSPDDPHQMKFEFYNRDRNVSVKIDQGVFLRFLLAA